MSRKERVAAREAARRDVQEANDVLSNARPVPASQRATYEEGLRLTRMKRDAANKTLGG